MDIYKQLKDNLELALFGVGDDPETYEPLVAMKAVIFREDFLNKLESELKQLAQKYEEEVREAVEKRTSEIIEYIKDDNTDRYGWEDADSGAAMYGDDLVKELTEKYESETPKEEQV